MILINEKINGQARERILIAAFRWLSDIDSKQFEQSCIIFQASEEQSVGLQIADLIARLKIKPAFLRRIVQMIIRRDLFKVLGLKPSVLALIGCLADWSGDPLKTDHLLESRLKPTLYLILYGVPDILRGEEMQTKKIVELFGDFVAIESSFTGEVHYLPNYWSKYPAAKRALEMIEIEQQAHKHVANIKKSLKFIENR